MKRKLMLLLACLFVGIGLVTAQTQKVTGVVISEEDTGSQFYWSFCIGKRYANRCYYQCRW